MKKINPEFKKAVEKNEAIIKEMERKSISGQNNGTTNARNEIRNPK
jgi:hypothetical protein